MNKRSTILALIALILAACGMLPQREVETRSSPAPVEDRKAAVPAAPGGYLAGDGPGTDIPANLDDIPDAVPKSEPLHRYANRPYIALGKNYTPLTATGSYRERGIASWYGKKFHGQPTSSGEEYDMYGMTAAHPTMPIPSYARVTNTASRKSVVVRVNDRGPFLHERAIDLSYTAAYKLGIIGNGSSEVEIESINSDTGTISLAMPDRVDSRPLENPAIGHESPATSSTAAGGIYLQLGAFKSQQAAESFMGRMRTNLVDTGKQLGMFIEGGLTSIRLGPYASHNEARSSADSLKEALGFMPIVKLR